MTALPHIQYFLGANAPGGFYSLYSELLPPEEARAIYILKGGPGCGKSTLMGRVGKRMEEMGVETEYILCSGDPDSLDGLVLPGLRVAIVDGTAPHETVSTGHCDTSPIEVPAIFSLFAFQPIYKRPFSCYTYQVKRAFHTTNQFCFDEQGSVPI